MPSTSQFIRAAKSAEGTDLWITGEIGVDVRFADLQKAFTYYSQENTGELILNIYSHGGYLDEATAFYDWVATSGTKFKVRIWGTAMSAATVIAAAAGRENIEIAQNASWMIHETAGGTDQMRTIGNDSLVRVYRALTGKKEKEIRDMIAATTTLNAQDAVAHGFAGKVMKNTMRLAAMYEAEPIKIENKPAMAETTNKLKVEAKVKLGTMEAVRAAMGEGVTIETEIDIDEATKATIQEKEAAIAALTTEVAALKAAQADGTAQAEARTIAETEANTAKAALVTANETHISEVTALKAAHVAEIAAMKAPVVAAVVANNVNVEPIAVKPSEVSEGAKIVKAALKQANPLQIAQAKMEAAKLAKA